jgi:hypothetical protein
MFRTSFDSITSPLMGCTSSDNQPSVPFRIAHHGEVIQLRAANSPAGRFDENVLRASSFRNAKIDCPRWESH